MTAALPVRFWNESLVTDLESLKEGYVQKIVHDPDYGMAIHWGSGDCTVLLLQDDGEDYHLELAGRLDAADAVRFELITPAEYDDYLRLLHTFQTEQAERQEYARLKAKFEGEVP